MTNTAPEALAVQNNVLGSTMNGLLVVGAGDLGARVARQWRLRHAEAPIVCATATPKRHAALLAGGYKPMLAADLCEPAVHVVFCAPPGDPSKPAYAEAVRAAAALARKRFVMTSSTGVLEAGPHVHEKSPQATTPRAQQLAAAENEALQSQFGVVIRLAGLYSLERGGHNYMFRAGGLGRKERVSTVNMGPDVEVSLVHYEDAASAVVAALVADGDAVVGQRFIAADGTPVSPREVVEAAHAHPMYSGFDMPIFAERGGVSKRVNSDWSRARLGWEPRHKSFVEFIREETRLAAATVRESAAVRKE